jgi:tetratricopeptide (TPR) repeat protein
VLLHEMLGGTSAYGEPESAAELLQRVRGAQLQPLVLHDAELQRLLARMTALQPADRIAAGDVIASLERIATRPRRRRRRIMQFAGVAAIVAILAGGVFIMRRLALSGGVFASRHGSRIAILPFRNATGDRAMQWIELGLMDHVARGLAGVRGADVIGGDAVLNAMKHLDLKAGTELASDARKRLLDAIGADALVAATVTQSDGRYTIRYAAFDRDRSEDAREVTSELITEAANRMSDRIAERIDPAARHRTPSGTRDTFAAIAYDMGRQLEMTTGGKYGEPYFAVAADRDPQFLEAKEHLADNWAKEGRLAEAQPMMEEVLREARKRNDRALLATALVNRAYWDYSRGDAVSEERYAREALAVAQQLGDPRTIAKAQNSLAIPLMAMNRLDEAEQLDLAALATARKLHSRVDEAPRLNNLGLLAARRGDREGAKRWLEDALRIGEEIGYRDMLTSVVGNLGTIYGDEGNFARAEELSKKQVAMARELGDKKTEIEGLANLGLWAYARGDEVQAIAVTEQAREAAKQFGALHLEALLVSNLAQARARLGDLAGAQRDADDGLAIGAKLRYPAIMPDVYLGAAYPAIRAGRLDEASQLIDRAEGLRKSQRGAVFGARLLYARRRYAEASKRIEEAKRMDEGTWVPQYESMRLAFAESAKTGKASTIRFEEPVKR